MKAFEDLSNDYYKNQNKCAGGDNCTRKTRS